MLDEIGRFASALGEITDMGSEEFECRSKEAVMFSKDVPTDQALFKANCALFSQALIGSQVEK